MQNTASTIIALFIAAILLFIIPIVTLSERNDDVTQENVKMLVDQFVTEIKNTGKITRMQYQNFENKLYATGNNTYTITMEIQHLDENPGKKTSQTNYTKIGENVYYSEYTAQILKRLGIKAGNQEVNLADDTILLKKGDFINIKVKNENSTAAQNLKSTIFNFSNAGEHVISARGSGMITVDGIK